MSAGSSNAWSEHDERVLQAFERDLRAGPVGDQMPVGTVPAPSQLAGRSLLALVASAVLPILDAAMPAASVHLKTSVLIVALLAPFPLGLAPVIRPGR